MKTEGSKIRNISTGEIQEETQAAIMGEDMRENKDDIQTSATGGVTQEEDR